MDTRLISIMLAFGAVALLSGGAPSLAAPSQSEYTRDKCIEIVIDLFDEIPIDDDVIARLNEAREYYYKDISPAYTPSPVSESCRSFVMVAESVGPSLPTACKGVMGTDRHQNYLDILKRSKAARLRLEASFACIFDHKAGNTMRTMGVFDAITDNN